jgi:hypothetical protein
MADWKEIIKLSPEEKAKVRYNDPRLDAFAAEVEKRYELPPGLIESVKNAGERSQTGQVSSKGAKGVMQFIDRTRKAYDHDVNDPLASIDAAGRYFKDLLKQYEGNPKAAIAAYNGGGVQGKKVLAGEEPTAKETKDYLARIKGYMSKKKVIDSAPEAKESSFTPDPRIDQDESYARQLFQYLQNKFDKRSDAPIEQPEQVAGLFGKDKPEITPGTETSTVGTRGNRVDGEEGTV